MSTAPEGAANTHNPRPNPPLDLLRNQLAFGSDSALFGIGIYFMPLTTVVTSLAAKLTDDKALIGAVSLVWYVSYLLPQLFAARVIHGKRRLKPFSVWPSVLGRPIILLFALWLYFTGAASPLLTVWVLLGCIVVFLGFDAFTSIAWFDMMGRAFSPSGRARILTVTQLIAGIGGIGAGFIVERVLGSSQFPFPLNYAFLLFCAWVFYELSLVGMLFIRERVSTQPENTQAAESHFWQKLRAAWQSDPVFRRLLLARLLTGVENMAAAFYVVFAKEILGLPDSAIGVFTIAYVIGGLLGTAIFGWLSARFGPRRVVTMACGLQLTAPVLALIVSFVAIPGTALVMLGYAAFVVVMALAGAVNRSTQVGFFSYAQDSAPELDRPMYVGAVSSIAGTAALMPVLGGLLIDGLTGAGFGAGAYSALFGLASMFVAVGAFVSLKLPVPRRV